MHHHVAQDFAAHNDHTTAHELTRLLRPAYRGALRLPSPPQPASDARAAEIPHPTHAGEPA